MGNMATAFRIAVLLSCVFASAARGGQGESATARPTAGTLGRRVNPFIGTGGNPYVCGNISPAPRCPLPWSASVPIRSPRSGRRATNSSGYYYHDDRILGFSHTRLSGTGARDGGNFLVLPCTESQSPAGARRKLEVRL